MEGAPEWGPPPPWEPPRSYSPRPPRQQQEQQQRAATGSTNRLAAVGGVASAADPAGGGAASGGGEATSGEGAAATQRAANDGNTAAEEIWPPPPLLTHSPVKYCLCCAITAQRENTSSANTSSVTRDTLSSSTSNSNSNSGWTAPFVETLLQQLRRRELRGSHMAAKRTAETLKRVVDAHPWSTTQELVDVVRDIGRKLICAAPLDLLVANVVRRVLCIFRTEHYKHQDAHRQNPRPLRDGETGGDRDTERKRDSEGEGRQLISRNLSQPQPHQQRSRWVVQKAAPSMASYFDPYAAADTRDFLLPVPSTVKQSIFESMSELLAEIDSLWEDGEEIRMSCFHDGDCILTFGYSLAVERLLIAVHEKYQKLHQAGAGRRGVYSRCSFEVVVLGGDAEDGGKRLARRLKLAGIQTTYVPDAALFPVITKVDKVLLGTVAVLSSGGIVTVGGANAVAQAARFFSKPLIAVAPLFKLTYLPFFDHHSSNELLPPAAGPPELAVIEDEIQICRIAEEMASRLADCLVGELMVPDGLKMGNVSIRIPMFDYVPRSLVSVFITDVGAVDPSYLFTLSRQRYHVDDIALSIVD